MLAFKKIQLVVGKLPLFKEKRGRLLYFLLLLLLPLTLLAVKKTQELRRKAQEIRRAYRVELAAYHDTSRPMEIGHQYAFSALVFGPDNQPIFEGFDYSWSISSDNSIGYLDRTTGKITNFIAENNGSGHLVVVATPIASVRLIVGEDFSRNCNQPCQNDDDCGGELICWRQQTPTPPRETNCINDNDCFWCGKTCTPKTYEDPCPMIMPPEEWDCVCQNNQCATVKNNEPHAATLTVPKTRIANAL